MDSTRRFVSLGAQVADVLRQEIERGTWGEWLPGERSLTETLQVSRKTLRKALDQLHREGRIEAVQGRGHRVLVRSEKTGKAKRDSGIVTLLTPEPLERMRPYTSLWVSRLKTLLIEKGVRLRTLDGHKYFSRNPARALEKLVAQTTSDCWLLANSTESAQGWFSTQKIPCMLAGSCHPGIDLPHVDLDHYALCRHAAGVLLAAGHRRLGLLNERSGRAGDAESEAGFITGVRESPHADAVTHVIHHEHSSASLMRALDRLLALPHPPTALLASNGASYLTVISALAQHGLRVPQDVSVISRDDEPFLSFLVPTPARYTANAAAFAKKLLKPLLQLLGGETVLPRSTRILPQYTRGASLGAPRAKR